jgi:hypothetical protein
VKIVPPGGALPEARPAGAAATGANAAGRP